MVEGGREAPSKVVNCDSDVIAGATPQFFNSVAVLFS